MKRETRLRPQRGGRFFGPVRGLSLGAKESERGCDCANAGCTLPPGRCFLCKGPVDNDRTYAICSECDVAHEVRASWARDYGAIEAHWRAAGDRECFCPGWLWMNEESDGSFNIERCDTCRTVRDDTDAARDVVVRCCIRGVEWP